MRKIVLGTALAMGVATAAMAQDGPVEGVIQAQIDAFLKGDVTTAFDYASPAIKRVFGSPERFGAMVETGYPMVYRPTEVEFLESREFGGGILQLVMMRDEAGVPWVLEYQMIEGAEGWVIDGVRVMRVPEVAA
jgi:hypothetical protein